MARKKKKLPWSKNQLAALHECWKSSRSRQHFLEIVAQKLPEIAPPIAWSLVRRLSRSDQDWQMTARQKEHEREKRRLTKERTKQDRLKRKDERQRAQEWKEQRETIRNGLLETHAGRVAAIVGTDFFFCPDMRQYVCRMACAFRVFSKEGECGFSYSGPCEKCERMDEHIPALERIIGRPSNERKKS